MYSVIGGIRNMLHVAQNKSERKLTLENPKLEENGWKKMSVVQYN